MKEKNSRFNQWMFGQTWTIAELKDHCFPLEIA